MRGLVVGCRRVGRQNSLFHLPELGLGDGNQELLAVFYNVADIINKIGFGIVAWMGAKKATEALAAAE